MGSTTLYSLFSAKPVLTHEEIARHLLKEEPSRSERTVDSFIAYHVKNGNLARLRRGLFALVPQGHGTRLIDRYLLAAAVTPDAILAYHTALEFFGRAYSNFETVTFLTDKALRPFKYQSTEFRAVEFPAPLTRRRQTRFGIKTVPRNGLTIHVTSLERTCVDVLDRLDLSGGWEEAWRSLASVEYLDLYVVIKYARLLDNATTASKLGLLLEQRQKQLMVDDKHLVQLERLRPKQPHYLQPGSRGGKLNARWNLIVPEQIQLAAWEET
jgi:predicted transcriptional regulator of viral defense system